MHLPVTLVLNLHHSSSQTAVYISLYISLKSEQTENVDELHIFRTAEWIIKCKEDHYSFKNMQLTYAVYIHTSWALFYLEF